MKRVHIGNYIGKPYYFTPFNGPIVVEYAKIYDDYGFPYKAEYTTTIQDVKLTISSFIHSKADIRYTSLLELPGGHWRVKFLKEIIELLYQVSAIIEAMRNADQPLDRYFDGPVEPPKDNRHLTPFDIVRII